MSRRWRLVARGALGDVLLALPVAHELLARGAEAVAIDPPPACADLLARAPWLTPPADLGADARRVELRQAARPWEPLGWARRALHRPTRLDREHVLERLRRAVGLTSPRLPLPPGSLLEVAPAAAPAGPGGLRVGLVVGAAHPAKVPPPELLAASAWALGARLQTGVTLEILGGPAEAAAAARLTSLAAARGVPADASALDLDLPGLAQRIASCAVVLGGDTGPLHLAQVLDVPAVVLFGPTSPARWGAWRASAASVSARLPCSPCSGHGQRPCRLEHRACLRAALHPEQVAAVAAALTPAGP